MATKTTRIRNTETEPTENGKKTNAGEGEDNKSRGDRGEIGMASPTVNGRDDSGVAEVARLRRRREQRNQDRLNLANETDVETTGESDNMGKRKRSHGPDKQQLREPYLTDDARGFFGEPIRGPDDLMAAEPWLLKAITQLAGEHTRTPDRSPIVFEQTAEAAAENARVLSSFDFDVKRMIEAHSDSTLGYGSEFRSVEQLRPLIGRHPNFGSLSLVLENGMPYVFNRELDLVTKSAERKFLIARGNHKSAKDFPDQVQLLLGKDVRHGFSIPLPVNSVSQIPQSAVQPLGLAQQWTLDEEGNRVVKFRMTQDLSFSSGEHEMPTSVNGRIDMEAYPEMVYGWCFPRILHYIIALRLAYPLTRILIAKYDYSNAYRRIAHSAEAAAQTIAIHAGLAYLALRLTFGGPQTHRHFATSRRS